MQNASRKHQIAYSFPKKFLGQYPRPLAVPISKGREGRRVNVKGPDRRGLRLPIFKNVTVPMLMSKVILKDLMFVTVTSVACVLLFYGRPME